MAAIFQQWLGTDREQTINIANFHEILQCHKATEN